MYWWQWVLVFLFVVILLFVLVIWFGLIFSIRFMKANPTTQAVWFDNDGRVKETRVLKSVAGDWKLLSTNPRKVRFKAYPRGIGFASEMEWDRDDFVEMPFAEKGRRIVHFNISGMNKSLFRISQRVKDERDHYFTMYWQTKGRLDQLAHDHQALMKQFKEDHEYMNRRAGIQVVKKGG